MSPIASTIPVYSEDYPYQRFGEMPQYAISMFYKMDKGMRNIDAFNFISALVPKQTNEYTKAQDLRFIVMDLCNGTPVKGSVKSWAKRNAGKLKMNSPYDRYVTVNNFRNTCRETDNCYAINGFVIDLDCHDAGEICVRLGSGALTTISDPKPIQMKASRTLKRLEVLWDAALLPVPTTITFTGRGLQLVFIYERSIKYTGPDGKTESKLVRGHKKVVARIYKEYEDALKGDEFLDIDYQCADISRVVRLPGSWNTKAGRFASLLKINRKAHLNFFELQDKYCPRHESKDTRTKTRTELKISDIEDILALEVAPSVLKKVVEAYREIEDDAEPQRDPNTTRCGDSRYAPLLRARMRALIALQQRLNQGTKTKGFRHNLTFLYYNCIFLMNKWETEVPGLPSVYEFNYNFVEPLSERELSNLMWSIQKREDGYYFRNETFIQFLTDDIHKAGMTTDEFKRLSASGKKRNRPSVTKMKRDAKIRVLAEMFLTNAYSMEELSELFHVHMATAYRWLKKAGIEVRVGKNKIESSEVVREQVETKQYAFDLFNDGMPANLVAEYVNEDVSAVCRWIDEMGNGIVSDGIETVVPDNKSASWPDECSVFASVSRAGVQVERTIDTPPPHGVHESKHQRRCRVCSLPAG